MLGSANRKSITTPAVRARRLRIGAVLAAVMALFFIAAGARQLTFVETGPRTTATVSACTWDRTGRTNWVECTGTWTDPNAGGRVVHGVIAGAQPGDEDKTFGVTLHDGRAWTADVFSPAVLIVMGVLIGIFGAVLVRMASRISAP